MTDEETRETMIGVASLAANAVSQAIGSVALGDPDPEMVEDFLAQALKKSLEKVRAGRTLDGVTHDALPELRAS